MNSPLATRIVQEHAAAHAPDAVPSARRRAAIEALAARGLPTARDENWKYANLRPLEKVRFAPAAAPGATAIAPTDLPRPIHGYARYTFVDGIFAPHLSKPATATDVSVRPWHEAPHAAVAEGDGDARFALLNEAFATDGAYIVAAAEASCPECLEFVFVATADAQAAASYPRLELQVGAGARLGLIERHVSLLSDANFINGAIRIELGTGAHLDHYRVQQSGARAVWFDTLTARVAAGAHYQLYLLNLGAASARSTMHVSLHGERAELGVHSVSVADAQQVQDAFALVEHAAPHTRSRHSFRGIAAGRSRVAFNSKVVVRANAHGTDSHQNLRGLLAGPGAEIDVRPQLEIDTDDVRCAHGATAGKLDEAMLFYLLSRGLERETAQRLLKWAFLEDVVAKIAVPELRRQIEQSLAGQLREPAGLEELL